MAIEAMAPLDAAFEVELPPAPYPGLRPFERHEWPIFFGREMITDEVIHRLIPQHLVVVHGDSGCGKSSLIRAGVLAQLEQEHARSGVRWRTCAMLPREAPLRNLANELAKLNADQADRNRIRQIRRCLNLGRDAPAALAELLRRGEDDHVCILIDQFEELFSFARKHGRDEAQLFVDILVGLQADPPPGLYGILTMRSEFLGVCARFEGLAEVVNKTQYLLPQMERPALLRAIREPATLYEGEVTRELAERLIADAGGGQDQLPLIQHGLMLLWRRKTAPLRGLFEDESSYVHPPFELAEARMPFRREDGAAWRLGLEDYQGSGLATLLSDHADEVMAAAAPDPKREKIVEHLFRALTDINAEGSAVRRPQTFGELMAVTGSDEQTLRDIIDRFRADGVSFLRPYGNDAINPQNEIDISHEALIRCWQKIADKEDGWLQREFQDGLIWQSLKVQAHKGETLSAAATEDRGAWLGTLPSPAWSKRYGGGWEDIQRIMAASRRARDEDARSKRELEEFRRREAEERAQRAEEARRVQERIAEEERQRTAAERARAAAAQTLASDWRSLVVVCVVLLISLPLLGSSLLGSSFNSVHVLIMFAGLYGVPIFSAVELKRRWRRVGDQRPVVGYLASGVVGAGMAALATIAFKSLLFLSFYEAFLDLRYIYPYFALAFMAAAATSFLCDDYITTPEDTPRFIRWLEGLAAAGVLAVTAYFVLQALPSTGIRPERIPEPQVFLPTAALIGLIIGAAVPSWYRNALRRRLAFSEVDLPERGGSGDPGWPHQA